MTNFEITVWYTFCYYSHMIKLLYLLCIIPAVMQAQEVLVNLPPNTHPLYTGPYAERTLARIDLNTENISIIAQPFDSCSDNPEDGGSLAYHPSGDLHCMTRDGIFRIDTSDLSAYPFDTTIAQQYDNTAETLSHAKYDPDGNLYFIIPASSVFDTKVGIYNISTQSVIELEEIMIDGHIPFWLYDICLANGKLFGLGITLQPGWHLFQPSLISIDIHSPDSSKVVYQPNTPTQLHHSSVVNTDCDSSKIFMRSYPIDGTGFLTAFSPSSGLVEQFFQNDLPGGKFAHPSESLLFDCKPVLGLSYSEDSGHHYVAPSVCYTPAMQFPLLSEADPTILSNTVIDSISVRFTDSQVVSSLESLVYTGALPYHSTPDGLIIHRPISLNNEELLDQLKDSLFYVSEIQSQNTSYERQLTILAYKRHYASDSTFLSFSLDPAANAGDDLMIPYCPTDDPINLDSVLVTAAPGGSWEPHTFENGMFSPAIDTIHQFHYLVDNGTCADAAIIYFQESPTPDFSLGPDLVLNEGEEIQLAPDQMLDGTYIWQDGSSASTFTAETPGLYTLTITNRSDCSLTDSVLVTLYTETTFPNQFAIQLPTVISRSNRDYPTEIAIPLLPLGIITSLSIYSVNGQSQCIECASWPASNTEPQQGIYFYSLLITTPTGQSYRRNGSFLFIE